MTASPKSNLGFAVALLILVGLAGVTYRQLATLDDVLEGHRGSHLRIEALTTLFSTLKDAESGQRGFLITQDRAYLAPYEQALTTLPDQLAALDLAMASSPQPLLAQAAELRQVVGAKLEELATTVLLNGGDASAQASAQAIVRSDRGLALMIRARRLVASLLDHENLTREYGQVMERNLRRESGHLLIVGLGSAILLVAAAALAAEGDRRRRMRLEMELRRAKDAAVTAAAVKADFLANMSHEIRTPLNGIIGMADLLDEASLGTEQRGYLAAVRMSGKNLLTIVNDVLDFSKIEAGKMELELVPFALAPLLEAQAEMVLAASRDKRLELLTYIDPSLPTHLRGDPGRLGQVVLNLLSNAVKFTQAPGHVTLRASAVGSDNFASEALQLRIEVVDTGIGIPVLAQRHLFQAFSQADSSTSRRFGGTGLGLSIAARLTHLMHGRIGCESVPGEGSTFWLELPLTVASSATVTLGPPERLRGLRVLVVDDDPNACTIFAAYLRAWGIQVETVERADACIARLHLNQALGRPFDVVLMDKRLPDQDGYSLAQTVQQDERLQLAPPRLVLVTGYDRRGQLGAARQAGFAAYLTKPVKQAQLLACFAEITQVSVIDPVSGDVDANVGLAAVATGERTLAAADSATARAAPPVIARDGTDPSYTPRSVSGPVSPSTFQPPAVAAGPAPSQPPPPVRRHAGLILVAEDNTVNQRMVLAQLSRLGYAAQAVSNGREAVEAVAAVPYAAVLMDCQMPEMDGYAATQAIRAREGVGRRLPIIALTAHAMQGDAKKCLDAGMDAYLTKPVQWQVLDDTLRRFVVA